MQRLMGRRTKTLMPTTESLLKPSNGTQVQKILEQQRKIQKVYFDKGAKKLPEIKPGEAIRMKTKFGTWIPGEYVKPHESPNSHVIKAGEQARLYRRNRRDLLVTKEDPHTIVRKPPPLPYYDRENVAKVNPPIITKVNPLIIAKINPQIVTTPPPTQSDNPPMITRAGRISKPPAWHKDYSN